MNGPSKNKFVRVSCCRPGISFRIRLLRWLRGKLLHVWPFLERLLLGIYDRLYREEAGDNHRAAVDSDVLRHFWDVRHLRYGPHIEVSLLRIPSVGVSARGGRFAFCASLRGSKKSVVVTKISRVTILRTAW